LCETDEPSFHGLHNHEAPLRLGEQVVVIQKIPGQMPRLWARLLGLTAKVSLKTPDFQRDKFL